MCTLCQSAKLLLDGLHFALKQASFQRTFESFWHEIITAADWNLLTPPPVASPHLSRRTAVYQTAKLAAHGAAQDKMTTKWEPYECSEWPQCLYQYQPTTLKLDWDHILRWNVATCTWDFHYSTNRWYDAHCNNLCMCANSKINMCVCDPPGKMFRTRDLPMITGFFLMFHKDKPIDWLLDHILWVKVCHPEKDAVSHSSVFIQTLALWEKVD